MYKGSTNAATTKKAIGINSGRLKRDEPTWEGSPFHKVSVHSCLRDAPSSGRRKVQASDGGKIVKGEPLAKMGGARAMGY